MDSEEFEDIWGVKSDGNYDIIRKVAVACGVGGNGKKPELVAKINRWLVGKSVLDVRNTYEESKKNKRKKSRIIDVDESLEELDMGSGAETEANFSSRNDARGGIELTEDDKDGTNKRDPELKTSSTFLEDSDEELELDPTLWKVIMPEKFFGNSISPEKRKELKKKYPKVKQQPVDIPHLPSSYLQYTVGATGAREEEYKLLSRILLEASTPLVHLADFLAGHLPNEAETWGPMIRDSIRVQTVVQERLQSNSRPF